MIPKFYGMTTFSVDEARQEVNRQLLGSTRKSDRGGVGIESFTPSVISRHSKWETELNSTKTNSSDNDHTNKTGICLDEQIIQLEEKLKLLRAQLRDAASPKTVDEANDFKLISTSS